MLTGKKLTDKLNSFYTNNNLYRFIEQVKDNFPKEFEKLQTYNTYKFIKTDLSNNQKDKIFLLLKSYIIGLYYINYNGYYLILYNNKYRLTYIHFDLNTVDVGDNYVSTNKVQIISKRIDLKKYLPLKKIKL